MASFNGCIVNSGLRIVFWLIIMHEPTTFYGFFKCNDNEFAALSLCSNWIVFIS